MLDEPGEEMYERGSGSVSLTLQTVEVSHFDTSVSTVDIGSVSTRSAYLEFEYAFANRWLVNFGLPYISKDYDGPAVHDPLLLIPPRPQVSFLDDGRWHSDFQDFNLGLRYLCLNGPTVVEPFARVIIPSHDYPHFAQAAVGQNLWKIEMGADVSHFFAFSDWYYRASGSYTVVEETLDVNVNHFRISGELGYFLTQTLAVHGNVQSKFGRGDDATSFPPATRNDERWYQHDRTSRHSYLNLGVGADWYFADKYQLSAGVLRTVSGRTVHLVDYAISLGLTRNF